jgi:hypothetical protein
MLANAQSKVMKTSPSFNKKTGDQRFSGKRRGAKERGRKEWGRSAKGYSYIRHLHLEYIKIQRGMSSYNCLDETMKSPALVVG